MRFKIFDNLNKDNNDQTIFDMIEELRNEVKVLDEKYNDALREIRRLENSLDARIDIVAEHCGVVKDV